LVLGPLQKVGMAQETVDQLLQLLVEAHLHFHHQELFQQEAAREAVEVERRKLVGLAGQVVEVGMLQELAGLVIRHLLHQAKEALGALVAHSQGLTVLAAAEELAP
jgi:hypothetical protein